jgi:2-C-methyl-D-erythritol 4-phosphate cytidylyltransferase
MRHLAWALVMASGKAEKLSAGVEIPFLYLNDRPVFAHSLAAFMQCPDIDGIVLSVPRERAESVLGVVQLCGFSKVRKIVAGKPGHAPSMAAALAHVPDDVEWLCVHDPAHPVLFPDTVAATVRSARRHGSGIAATPIPGRVVAAKKGAYVSECAGGDSLWSLASPQTWSVASLRQAYPASTKERQRFSTDWDAMLAQGIVPRLVEAPPSFRIRGPADLEPALAELRRAGLA